VSGTKKGSKNCRNLSVFFRTFYFYNEDRLKCRGSDENGDEYGETSDDSELYRNTVECEGLDTGSSPLGC